MYDELILISTKDTPIVCYAAITFLHAAISLQNICVCARGCVCNEYTKLLSQTSKAQHEQLSYNDDI